MGRACVARSATAGDVAQRMGHYLGNCMVDDERTER
jgi:hypothetical protein